jgi:hypothetical protein
LKDHGSFEQWTAGVVVKLFGHPWPMVVLMHSSA